MLQANRMRSMLGRLWRSQSLVHKCRWFCPYRFNKGIWWGRGINANWYGLQSPIWLQLCKQQYIHLYCTATCDALDVVKLLASSFWQTWTNIAVSEMWTKRLRFVCTCYIFSSLVHFCTSLAHIFFIKLLLLMLKGQIINEEEWKRKNKNVVKSREACNTYLSGGSDSYRVLGLTWFQMCFRLWARNEGD